MREKLIVGVLALAAAASIVGSYSALAGEGGEETPEPEVSPTVTVEPTETPEVTPTPDPSPTPEPTPTPVPDEEDEGDDVDDPDDETDAAGANKVASAIAEAFGVSVDEVMAYHEQGIGFGALFKLYALADATGKTVDGLIAERGDGGWAFGKKFKELSDEERETLKAGPKNLGSVVSKDKKPAHAGGHKP